MTNNELLHAISSLDSKMRAKAHAMCGSQSLGDDIWHDAVLKILTSYKDREAEDLNIAGLMYSALYSCFMDNRRKNGMTETRVDLKYAEQEVLDNGYSVYSRLEIGEIQSYLSTLNKKHSEIFLMGVFGMDNKSISDKTGESVENVRKIIFRIRKKIKSNFNEKH